MDLGLHDKVAFIARSSLGIGLAIARVFLHEGAKVVITSRQVESRGEASALFAAKDCSLLQASVALKQQVTETQVDTIVRMAEVIHQVRSPLRAHDPRAG